MVVTNRKVGGIRFVRVGRMQMSFCLTKAAPREAKGRMVPDMATIALLAVFAANVLVSL